MVYTERAEMAAVSCGTSHASAVSIIIDRFYIALFPALEQTHCARM